MKVLLTGATGVIGRLAVPSLIEAGHEVVAVFRDDADRIWLEEQGATPVSLDLFDPDAVDAATAGAGAVVHHATAIPPASAMRKPGAWSTNDRLRTEAAAHLTEAAARHGVEVFVQQSVTFVYADGGSRWIDEESPVDPPAPIVESALVAEQHTGRFTASGGRGVVLRFARLYGPGRASAGIVSSVRTRAAPVVGRGANYVSSLHVADAAAATVAAISLPAGIYNVCDDRPVTSRDYFSSLAAQLGAPEPRRVPRWVARIAAGRMLAMLTVSQKVSNRKFKGATGWEPLHPSVIEGWGDVVASITPGP